MKFLMVIMVLTAMVSSSAYAKCSKADAKKAVIEACKLIGEKGKPALKEIKKKRHCGNNYVWIQDGNMTMVMHPIKRKLIGKMLKELADEDGIKFFQEFDKMAKNNKEGGWVSYKWSKAGAEKPTPKTSFVKKCPGPQGWIAGSGIWL